MAALKDPTKLFDFIAIMFTQPKVWDKLKPYDKARHFFMVNRFMSINHPIQANYLQHIKVNPAEVMNYWQQTMTRLYTRVPSWMYIKTKKAKAAAKKTKFVDDDTIKEYCTRMGYSRRQINESIDFFGDKFIDELKLFEKVRKQ
jgi:hypothetical protein